jgi:hypothetical protein
MHQFFFLGTDFLLGNRTRESFLENPKNAVNSKSPELPGTSNHLSPELLGTSNHLFVSDTVPIQARAFDSIMILSY